MRAVNTDEKTEHPYVGCASSDRDAIITVAGGGEGHAAEGGDS